METRSLSKKPVEEQAAEAPAGNPAFELPEILPIHMVLLKAQEEILC